MTNILTRRLRNRRGMTVVEAIVAISLFVTIFAVGVEIFSKMQVYYLRNRVRSELSNEARICFDTLSLLVRKADPSSVALTSTAGRPYSVLTFTIPAGG